MTCDPTAPRNRAALDRKSSALKGLFFAGMIFVAPPALANPNDDPNVPPGCNPSDETPQKCDEGIPVPLAAAGIPALLVLGGGFIAIRNRRRDSKIKK